MNGIKGFIKKITEDKNFAKKFEGKNAKETAELARKEGFNFTPEEFMDVKMEAAAGGIDWGDVGNFAKSMGKKALSAGQDALLGEEKEDGVYMVKDGIEYFTTTPKDNSSWKPTGKQYRRPGTGLNFSDMF